MRRTLSILAKFLLAALAALGLGALTASAAGATTFCVHPVASQHCVGTAEPDLQTALDAAKTAPNDTHRNTVVVGNPGAPPGTGYAYGTANPATNPVDVIGAGQGTTTLTYSGGSSSTVLQMNGDGSSVSNLRVLLPATGGTGISLTGGSARGVLVTSPGPQTASLGGVTLVQGSTPTAPARSFTQSKISFPTSGGTTAQTPVVAAGGVLVRDVAITGQNTTSGGVLFTAVAGYPGTSTARRVSIRAVPQTGTMAFGLVISGAGVTVNADNIAISVSGGAGTSSGVLVSTGGPANTTLNLNHASVYGNGDVTASPSSFGVYDVSTGGAAAIKVRNSIIRNFFYGTVAIANGATASSNVRYDYSDYDFIHTSLSAAGGGTASITKGVGNLNDVDPAWLNPLAGDFRLPASSAVINKGDPAHLNPLVESITDVLGHPRISNHRRDMGAVEFQFPPPRFKLKTGTFDPSNGKVRLPALCDQPATDRCRFKITLKAKLKMKVNGKTKKKTVTLKLKGSAAGGSTKTLAAKLPSKALPFVQGLSKLKLAAGGTVTDNEAAVARVTGHVKLKAGQI